ncbi:type VI secretion system tip protein TssI/VgrG [Paraburkholderia sp. BL17N1]|uniref:type VI secretion system Vgr family protein n=1 Tax=Paraburkholderia sp. BL17N1 TaxID=1938798 RepID=UPI000EB14960|nr:type VI secretion system tip protein TssI/VgrG [Paraburkholderia sp. BL17N1]RKR42820.1 type VI secretion system secreted protein VgrG [Paraburkholderia sp. BL17N1]
MSWINSWLKQPRTLEITGKALPQWSGEPLFAVSRLRGKEKLGHLYDYEVELSTVDDATLTASEAQALVDVDALIGKEVTVHIAIEGNGTWMARATGATGTANIGADIRKLTGLIVAAKCIGADDRRAHYRLRIRPWLWLATLNRDSRLWQERSVIQITEDTLQRYSFPYELRLAGPGVQRRPYPKREYQRQWWESDFAFLNRLWQEWGITFFFTGSTLVLCDSPGAYKKHGPAYQTLRYVDRNGQRIDEEHVHEFHVARQITTGKVALTDYDYTQSLGNLAVSQEDYSKRAFDNAEEYAWGDYSQPFEGPMGTAGLRGDPQFEGEHLARVKVEAHRAKSLRANGKGNLRGLMTGHTFTLEGYPLKPGDGEYLVVSTDIDLVNNDTVTQSGGIELQYSCTTKFSAVPANTFYRTPQRAKRPRAYAETALITGYGDEPVYCDEYGRVKAHFIWDRIGEKDENASCWLRVASPWHGVEHGAMWLPRVGHHVLVGYYDSDPDRPYIISGHTTEFHQAPWQLPKNDALSGWRSQDLKGQSANSVVTDDTPGKLQVQVASDHAQSRLVLGYNTRIDGHAGRDRERGEGFELGTDAHGVLRANQGMLITTAPRSGASAPMKDMTETAGQLATARDQHDAFATLARAQQAQERGDQDAVASALRTQHDDIRGSGKANQQKSHFPELSKAHLVLNGEAGLAGNTPCSMHLAAGEHVAMTSGGHTALSVGRRLLVSVANGIRTVVQACGWRLVAMSGDIDLKALKDSINLLAKLNVTVSATTIRISADQEVEIGGGGSYTRWTAGQIRSGTSGQFEVHSAGRVFTGPDNVGKPKLPESQDMQQDLHFALRALPDEAHHYAYEPYELYKGDAKIAEGATDESGRVVVKNHQPGTSAYRVKLSNGGQFELKVKDALHADPAHADQRSNRGERLA